MSGPVKMRDDADVFALADAEWEYARRAGAHPRDDVFALAGGGTIGKAAEISECGKYRYSLYRTWDATRPHVLFVMLNPSTADASKDDPTIRRCVGFAKSWGYGGIAVGNLFAFRATDPKVLRTVSDPIGPRNAETLDRLIAAAGLTVCAWGVHGTHLGRNADVLARIPDPHCLGATKDSHPLHPLYVPAKTMPCRFPSGVVLQ